MKVPTSNPPSVIKSTKSYTTSTPTVNRLQAQEILDPNAKDLIKIVTAWTEIAINNSSLTSSQNEASILFDSASSTIGLANRLRDSLSKNAYPLRIFTCKDSLGKLQAIALAENHGNDSLYLNYLATNPHNILPIGNVPCTRGAGTAIFNHLLKTCVKENTELALYAFESSVPFYEKQGLETIQVGSGGGTDMRITASKIQTMLKKRAPSKEKALDNNL